MMSYLFVDATAYLSKVITVFMDESTGRENLINFFKLLNTAAPFLLLNDYRIAK